MELQDRDYMHERRQRSPFTPPSDRGGLFVASVFLALAVLLYLGYDWLLTQPVGRSLLPAFGNAKTQPAPATASEAPPSVWHRCLINGHTVFSASVCPSLDAGPAERPRAPQVTAGSITLYHCKAYAGGTFWANTHCNQHRALVDRMVTVPADIPFAQQVELAEGARRAAATLQTTPSETSRAPAVSSRAPCDGLAQQIEHLDAMARQPQSAQTQDRIRTERGRIRDLQAALRC